MTKKRTTEARWIEARKHWRIDVQKDGERKSFYSTVPKRKGKIEAESKADEWLMSATGEDIRFGVLWAGFLATIDKANGSCYYRQQEYLGRVWILPRLEHKKVSSITLQDMQECINAPFEEKGLTKKTCANIRGALTAVYRYAHKCRAPLERPEFLTVPKGAGTKKKDILQPDMLKVLFTEDCINHYGKPETAYYIHAWRFLVLTGLRRGELAGLMLADIENNVLHISRSVNNLGEITGGKTENANRYIVLSQRMTGIIEEQKRHLKRHGVISPYIFPSRTGVANANLIKAGWDTYRKQRGWDGSITLQSMRRTMISVAKAHIPEAMLKDMVGHSASMDTLGVYGRRVDGEAEMTSKMLSDIYDDLLK